MSAISQPNNKSYLLPDRLLIGLLRVVGVHVHSGVRPHQIVCGGPGAAAFCAGVVAGDLHRISLLRLATNLAVYGALVAEEVLEVAGGDLARVDMEKLQKILFFNSMFIT